MAAKTAFSQKKKKSLYFGRTLEPAFIVARCCIKGTYKYEQGKNETGSRGRVKMRNGVGEATGGTWPTYSSGGEEERWKIKEWEGKRKGEGGGRGKGGREEEETWRSKKKKSKRDAAGTEQRANQEDVERRRLGEVKEW